MAFDLKGLLLGFVLSLAIVLFVSAVNSLMIINAIDGTLLNQGFVVDLFEKHKVSEFVYNDVLPNALGEVSPAVVPLLQQLLPFSEFKKNLNKIIADFITYLKDPQAKIPDIAISVDLSLNTADLLGANGAKLLADAREWVQIMLSTRTILLIASLALLVIIALIPKTVPDKLKKIGYALFLAALSGIALYFSFEYIVPGILKPLFGDSTFLINAFLELNSVIAGYVFWQSAPLLVLGVIISAAGFFIAWKSKKQEQALGK